jgi:hypothetical protein
MEDITNKCNLLFQHTIDKFEVDFTYMCYQKVFKNEKSIVNSSESMKIQFDTCMITLEEIMKKNKNNQPL